MIKIMSENAVTLMKVMSELDGLKEEMNEAIEFLLDKEGTNQLDDYYTNLIEDKMADLRLIVIAAGYEFSQK